MINTIFFDFDGVIVESVDIKTKAFAKLFEHQDKNNVEKIVNYHLENAGVSRYEKFKYIYKEILKCTLSDDEFQLLCDKFAHIVLDAVINASYVKGAKEFLENYASKYLCFIVSATPQEEIEQITIKRNINHYFKGIYGSPRKKTDIVRNVLISEGVKPSDSLFIGDALSDYNAANNNSVHFVVREHENDQIFANIECLKVRDLTNLNDVIETL